MARTEGFFPEVPLEYRGVEVCDNICWEWLSKAGALWRQGVDMALDALIEDVERECKSLEDDGTNWFPDDWTSGRIEGKDMAAEYVRDVLSNYKKES